MQPTTGHVMKNAQFRKSKRIGRGKKNFSAGHLIPPRDVS
jgi:hypothetical protein